MTMKFQTNIQNPNINKWVNEYKDGYSLPRSLYTKQEAFNFDMQTVFHNNWIYVATEADVVNPGDYYCFNLCNNSIIICRDDNGELNSFHNSCCHRGSLICKEGRRNVAKLVCPYHQWTYNLDGKLIFAPQQMNKLNLSEYSLKPIHIKSIGGLIFICLGDDPSSSIDNAILDLAPYIEPYNIKGLKVAIQNDIVEEANWKLIMENNRECYHCKSNHPELLASLHEYGFGFDPAVAGEIEKKEYAKYEELLKNKQNEWQSCNLAYEEKSFPNNSWYRVIRIPLAHGSLSQTTDGKLGCKKLLAPFKEPETSSLALWTHPNSWHHFTCDHIITFKVMPLNENQSLVRTKWLVREDAVEGEDYDIEHLSNSWVQTNKQDQQLAENNFAGIKTGGYRPGPYSQVTEKYVDNFTSWYIKQLRNHL